MTKTEARRAANLDRARQATQVRKGQVVALLDEIRTQVEGIDPDAVTSWGDEAELARMARWLRYAAGREW